MKKIIIVMIAVVFLFAACTKAEQEVAVKELNESEETEEAKEEVKEDTSTPEPTEEATQEPTEEAIEIPNMVAIVIALDGYAPSELHPVIDAVAGAGYEFAIVSSEQGTADGRTETSDVTYTFSDFASEDLRGIVVIGGSESLWENEDLHALIAGIHELDRVTAGICLNSVALAKAGVIGEGDTACWFNCDIADPEMEALGVVDSGQPVTVNGNIITGDGPSAAEEFATEVVAALNALG
jgi:protease I